MIAKVQLLSGFLGASVGEHRLIGDRAFDVVGGEHRIVKGRIFVGIDVNLRLWGHQPDCLRSVIARRAKADNSHFTHRVCTSQC